MGAKQAFIFFRYGRWLMTLAAIGVYVEFLAHRSQHLNSFGQLSLATEFWMFFLPLAVVMAGCFEMMMREIAGIPRPGVRLGIFS